MSAAKHVTPGGRVEQRRFLNSTSAKPVHRCSGVTRKRLAPNGFPILTCAISCFHCGFVFEYDDNDELIERYKILTKGKERPRREFVVRRRVGIQTHADEIFDKQEAELAAMIKDRIPVSRIAEILQLPVDYVHAHARLSGWMQ